MAAFLRRKLTNDDPSSRRLQPIPQSEPLAQRPPSASPPVTPLFARFATSSNFLQVKDPVVSSQLVVSGPMPLSNGRKTSLNGARGQEFRERMMATGWRADGEPDPNRRQAQPRQPKPVIDLTTNTIPDEHHAGDPDVLASPLSSPAARAQPPRSAGANSPTKANLPLAPAAYSGPAPLPLSTTSLSTDYRKEKPLPIPLPESPSQSPQRDDNLSSPQPTIPRVNGTLQSPQPLRPAHSNTIDSLTQPHPVSNPRQTPLTSRSNPALSTPQTQPIRPSLPTPKATYPLLQPTRIARRTDWNSSNRDIGIPRSPSPSKPTIPLGQRHSSQSTTHRVLPFSPMSPTRAERSLSRDQRPPSPLKVSPRPSSRQANRQTTQQDWPQGTRAMSPSEGTFVDGEPQYMHFKEPAVTAVSHIRSPPTPVQNGGPVHVRQAAPGTAVKQTEMFNGVDTYRQQRNHGAAASPRPFRNGPTPNGSATSLVTQSQHSHSTALSSGPSSASLQHDVEGKHPPEAEHPPRMDHANDWQSKSQTSIPSRSASVRSISDTPANAAIRSKPLIFAAMPSVDERRPPPPPKPSQPFALGPPPGSRAHVNAAQHQPLPPIEQRPPSPSPPPPLPPKPTAPAAPLHEVGAPGGPRRFGGGTSLDYSSPLPTPPSSANVQRFVQQNEAMSSPLPPPPLNPVHRPRRPSKSGSSSPKTRPASILPAWPPVNAARPGSSGGAGQPLAVSHGHSHGGSRAHAKTRPVTPVSQGGTGASPRKKPTLELEYDPSRPAGLPLDDDPFAKVEGVQMLRPSSSSGREAAASSPRVDGSNPRKSSHHARDGRAVDRRPHQPRNGSAIVQTAPVHAMVKDLETRADAYVNPRLPPPPTHHHTPSLPEAYHTPDKGKGRAYDETPFTLFACLSDHAILSCLLMYLSFNDWCVLSSVNKHIRTALWLQRPLREEVLERFLETVGYTRWRFPDPEPLCLSLMDLNAYMRGVSIPTHEYARVAESWLQSQFEGTLDPTLRDVVIQMTASTRAYTRVVLRLRAQAEAQANYRGPPGADGMRASAASPTPRFNDFGPPPTRDNQLHFPNRAPSPSPSIYSQSQHGHSTTRPNSSRHATFHSPLFKTRRAPVLHVFVPSPDGDWLSDVSVLECEAELKRAGVLPMLRVGDVVWDLAIGDEGNVGRMVWDGSYLLDLDFTYSAIGDIPKYIHTLAFPPSYFHRVIRTGPSSSNPIVHIDISPWGEEIASNLQLLQDRVRTETPQGTQHNVIRWVHRSSFVIKPGSGTPRQSFQYRNQYTNRPRQSNERIPIPGSHGLFVDPGWYGTIVVESEGTNEGLADLQDRCGPGVFPPRPMQVSAKYRAEKAHEEKNVFRVLRERSRPGEIWIRTVSEKERLQ